MNWDIVYEISFLFHNFNDLNGNAVLADFLTYKFIFPLLFDEAHNHATVNLQSHCIPVSKIKNNK